MRKPHQRKPHQDSEAITLRGWLKPHRFTLPRLPVAVPCVCSRWVPSPSRRRLAAEWHLWLRNANAAIFSLGYTLAVALLSVSLALAEELLLSPCLSLLSSQEAHTRKIVSRGAITHWHAAPCYSGFLAGGIMICPWQKITLYRYFRYLKLQPTCIPDWKLTSVLHTVTPKFYWEIVIFG